MTWWRNRFVPWIKGWNSSVAVFRAVIFVLLFTAPAFGMSPQAYFQPYTLALAAIAALLCVIWPRTPIPMIVMTIWVLVWVGYTVDAGILDAAIWRGMAMGMVFYLVHSLLAIMEHMDRNTSMDRESILTWGQHLGGVLALTGVVVAAIWALTTYVPALPGGIALIVGLLSLAVVIYILARMLHRSAYESAE